jgi:hypothetical protein
LPDSTFGLDPGTSGLDSSAVCTPVCTDPDLARVVEAWPTLPDHIRAAILALASTARGS